jgi:hypothetical protein
MSQTKTAAPPAVTGCDGVGNLPHQYGYGPIEFAGTVNALYERHLAFDIRVNGALTLGTRDGSTIEMAQEAGEDNFFLFGLTAEQVANSRGWYNPYWHYEHEPETRAALDMIFADHFSSHEPGIFAPLRSCGRG